MSTDIQTVLRSIGVFKTLEDRVLDQVAPFVATRTVRAGETIFCQGEPSPYCFGIVSGEVVIQHVSRDPRFPPKVLGVLGPGSLFGEAALFEDSPRVAMASATQEGRLLMIRGPQLREWMGKNPETANIFLMAILRTSLERLRRTDHELAVVYGVGRLLGSGKPFEEQLTTALEFLKGSLVGVDEMVFYQRNPFWEEFAPKLSLPALEELPAIPLRHELVEAVRNAGSAKVFDPKAMLTALGEFRLPWQDRTVLAVIPLFDWDQAHDPLQGLLCLTSTLDPAEFVREKLLLLTSVSRPLAEALSRHRRQEDAVAQERLNQAKNTYRP
jgi:CRP-like cAMP-binding protein